MASSYSNLPPINVFLKTQLKELKLLGEELEKNSTSRTE
jgi:hypothetical protein